MVISLSRSRLDRSRPMRDQIYPLVRRMILTGAIKPGEVIDEKAIAAQLNVSRTPVREAVKKIAATGKAVPEPLVKLLVSRKDLAVIPIIDDLWAQDATSWEELYSAMGPAIEDPVLARFDKGTVTTRMSAIRLLGKNGTAKSLPVLEGAREESTPEVRVLIDRAIASIRSRE